MLSKGLRSRSGWRLEQRGGGKLVEGLAGLVVGDQFPLSAGGVVGDWAVTWPPTRETAREAECLEPYG